MENSLEKGKSMPIGTITNGFKKIAEGKWRKVSEHGKTKEEHIYESDKYGEKLNRDNLLPEDSKKYYLDESKRHTKEALKLDSKEYSDVDVVGKEKEEDYSKEYSRGDKIVVGKLSMKVAGFTEDGRMKVQNNQGENFTLTKDQTKKYVEADRNRSGKAASIDDKSKVDKSTTNDIEKALVTLEIGYLAGQVSDEQIKEARKTAKNG